MNSIFKIAGLALLLTYTRFLPAQGQAVVSTFAGSGTAGRVDGPAATAQFNQPYGIAVDGRGTAYVADLSNHVIRKITAQGVVSTFVGSGTPGYLDSPFGPSAQFSVPYATLLTPQGDLLVADTGNDCIRKVDSLRAVTTFAGIGGGGGYADGPASTARFSGPIGLAQDAAGNTYVSDAGNNRIRRIDPAGNVTTIAGSGVRGHLDGPAATARFFEPQGLALDRAGNLYIADRAGNRIRKLTPAGVVSTYAGVAAAGYLDGPAATANFNAPIGVVVDGRGDVYVTERLNRRLRRIEAATVLVSTIAGTGTAGDANGPALTAQFSSPHGLAFSGGSIYVADFGNHRIRRIAGSPLAASAGVGVTSAPLLALEVFPNPTNTTTIFRYQLHRADQASLTVFDALGRAVAWPLSVARQSAGWHEVRSDAANLPAGLYFVRLAANGKSVTKQVTVIR